MRTIFTLLAFVSVCWAGPQESTVKVCRCIYVDNDEGQTVARHNYGTGVVVYSGKDADGQQVAIILTNAHVAPSNATYHILWDGKMIDCDWVTAVPVEDRSEKGDLAVLMTYFKMPSITIANKDPPINDEVFQWSHPKAGRLTKLTGKWLDDGGGHTKYTSYLSLPGCSGSGVFHKDKLVGLCFAVSNLKDKNNNVLKDINGNPILTSPTIVIGLEKINNFLLANVAKEMGFIVEKGPMPRHIPRGSDSR